VLAGTLIDGESPSTATQRTYFDAKHPQPIANNSALSAIPSAAITPVNFITLFTFSTSDNFPGTPLPDQPVYEIWDIVTVIFFYFDQLFCTLILIPRGLLIWLDRLW